MKNFITDLLTNEGLMAIIAAIITVVGSLLVANIARHYSLTKQRYETFIAPLYQLSEPLLYRPLSSINPEPILAFIAENSTYAKFNLIEASSTFRATPTQDNYSSLCDKIGSDYDRSRFYLGLKARSLTYRLNNNLYRNQKHMIMVVTILALQQLFFVLAYVAFCLLGILLATSLLLYFLFK